MSVNTEMNLGEAWRKALQDEISKPMKPVPGRIAFLKGLGYLEEELHKLTLFEFDQSIFNSRILSHSFNPKV